MPGEAAYAVVGGEPYFTPANAPALPAREIVASSAARTEGLPWARAVRIDLGLRRAAIHPRHGNLEIREFSRKAITPAVTPQQTLQRTQNNVLGGAIGEAMEITNQPHPPADLPIIWQAGPQSAPPVDLMLGDLARLDFSTTGFEAGNKTDAPAQASRPVSAPQVPLVAPEPAPLAASTPAAPMQSSPQPIPVPQPVVAKQPGTSVVPEPVTKPLPVTLPGAGAGPARPASLFSGAAPVAIEPQVPTSSALPLRPTMVLAPRPAPAPEAKSVATQPSPAAKPVVAPPAPAAAANGSTARTLRGPNPGKNRRPEVRVIQTNPSAQQATPAPAPIAQNVRTITPNPAPVPPAAAKVPVAAPKPNPVRAEPTPVLSSAKPEIDLHLPEIHNPEVMGPWGRLPVAVKAGIGAILALGIIGFAYTALNSSNAAAKVAVTAAANLTPAYNLGKQINSGGWIDDWAPADKERRITLLRGSQPYSDYRIEFDAQIQNKAIGWMYRGLNPRNYYVVKLEKLKPGIEPVVALVRYAVIDGESEKRSEKILPMKVRVDTTYKIRFDAVGNEFAVWVQGKKIDGWRDSRLGSGGVGLYSEGEEASAVHGTVNVFELVSTK